MSAPNRMGLFDLLRENPPPLVEQAFEHVESMLEDGNHMFAASAACALDNEILSIDLHALDKDINQREQKLRRAVLEHLTIDPQREMVFSLKLVSIVHEAERIGDITKSLVKARHIAHEPRMGPWVEPLRDLRDRILVMFEHAKQGFVEENVEAARTLMAMHESIKDDVTAYLQHLADAEDITANEGIVYALIAHLLSRVSSHLSNIASVVALPFDQIRRAHGSDNASA